jgi:LmbE family N-acetylglucosaminyl deacetylase
MGERSRLLGLAALVVACGLAAAAVFGWRHRDTAQRGPLLDPPAKEDRVLIVAPHIDDEAIAAAGYAAAGLRRGAAVSVVYVTSGDCNRTSAEIMDFTLHPGARDYLAEGKLRIQEAVAAMAVLGVPRGHLYFLGYPDRGIRPMLENPGQVIRSPGTGRTAVPYEEAVSPGAESRLENLEKDLRAVLDKTRPTIVLVPVLFDAHPDHSATGRLTQRLLRHILLGPRRLGYLVHARHFPSPFRRAPRLPLLPPARFAGAHWALFPMAPPDEVAKLRVLRAYRSQRRDPYLFVLMDAFIRRNELFVEM